MSNLGFHNLNPIIHGYLFESIFPFWTGFILYKVLTFYHLAFVDKGQQYLTLHICNHLPEVLKAKSSFQTFKRSLNDFLELSG